MTDKILHDEAVLFISERHHATAKDVIDSYAAQCDGTAQCKTAQGKKAVCLEDNEVQIIHDLMDMYDKNI